MRVTMNGRTDWNDFSVSAEHHPSQSGNFILSVHDSGDAEISLGAVVSLSPEGLRQFCEVTLAMIDATEREKDQ